MATITVSGSALQTAIDKASPGDTIIVKAGTYAGRLHIFGKPLTFIAEGEVIIDGGQGDGFVNVDIDKAAVTMEGFDYRHAGAALRFTGDCSGSRIAFFKIPVVDWMVRNTPYDPLKPQTKSDDNGGNAFQLTKREGQAGAVGAKGIIIEDGEVRSCRAVSSDYGRDGGIFEVYGGAQGITVRRVKGWDNVNVFESGKGGTDPDNGSILLEDCVFHGRPDPSSGATQTTVANGLYVRAINGLTVRRCEFDKIDWWSFTFISTGGFAGGIQNVQAVDNVYRLLPGVNRMLATDAGVDVHQLTFDRDKVWVTNPNTAVAEVAGKRYLVADKAALTAATGWEGASTWGAEPPAQTCEQQLADVTRKLATSEAARQTAEQQRDAAIQVSAAQRGRLDQINVLSAAPPV